MNYKLLLSFLVLPFCQLYGQTKVSGTVQGEGDEFGLPGVTVQVKGSLTGTQTDAEGKYQIMASKGESLVFSFIGMEKKEVLVENQSIINVILNEQANQLNEVVVLTALGLERKKDDDLSSSTLIDAEAIKRSGESGVIQGLSGKTSGLTIVRNSGDPGAGAYIQIRGQNTISGSSSPLIILDGVPISNSSSGGGIDGVVGQSRLNDINPDDIANVTVLKGAAAAAVWGTGAANGVIVIQTKRGNPRGKKVSVDFTNMTSFDVINREFERQEKFGQGNPLLHETGRASDAYTYIWNPTSRLSWGDRIRDRVGGEDDVRVGNKRFEAADGSVYYPILTKNSNETFSESNRDQVFQTGFTWNKSLSLNFNGNSGSTFMSFSNWDQKGILKANSDYTRTTARLNNETKISENIKIRVNSSVTHSKSNRIQQGSNLNGFYLGYLRTPADFDNSDYIGTYYDNGGAATQNAHRSYIGNDRNLTYLGEGAPFYPNPGWVINQQENPSELHRFLFNPEFNWNIMKDINFTARYGFDYYNQTRDSWFPVNSSGDLFQGSYGRSETTERNTSVNAFLNGTHVVNSDFNFSWITGVQFEDGFYTSFGGNSTNFTNPFVGDLRTFGNAEAANETPSLTRLRQRKSGVYAVLNSEFKNQFYFELTGRYELPSTLTAPVFYPSASLGWVFTEQFESNLVTFGKVRASYGEVGIEPISYANQTSYGAFDRGSSWGDALSAAVYGNPFGRSPSSGNPGLTPERVREYEVGTDVRFFNDKVSLGVTYYNRKTDKALLAVDLAPSTGFTSVWDNAAVISNKGLEVDMGFRIAKFKDIEWRIDANFSTNQNMVESLSGVKSVTLNGFTGTSSRVVEGEPFAALWGGKWARDDRGNLILNSNGFPEVAEEEGVIGDPNPKWKGGLGSNISWKGLSLSFQFETFQGNDIWAGTESILKYFGVHPETANEFFTETEMRTVDGRIVAAGTLVRGNVADFGAGNVLLDSEWYTGVGGGFGTVSEPFIVDGSWTKLREVTLAYDLPQNLISKAKLSRASLSISGRNLFIWSPLQYVDPEVNLTGSSKGRGLEYFTNPGTGSYIISLKLGV
ncbi:SusC/RagA family TonB-linked outer membrane protein [Arcticibacterium luteifluviistationis]|uniref:SusC/RagA family TonB-linked outer membrane protein n=1 Tax=Arcticibacterium luteifluviistationis TaxID=1784714 RepID=A0A2Z4GC07_9BACT|nr:SusC/RagA family TonB-linked outer membrane protein [Arcticibacterium luteifluviistationis]AWV98691.1 SusC/RagA family TonB-linked outer membrane protein [Arcticibacterium luteifluviistationis]